MIPLRDNVPRVNTPWVVYGILALNILAYLYEAQLSRPELMRFVFRYGVVPLRYFEPDWARAAGFPADGILPLFTYMFLHSGLLHVGLNMWFLWIFADNVEDACGHGRFLAFYLICGLAALGTHLLFNPGDKTPIVGASGAIAGVLGAYFMLYPHGKILTFIPIFIIPWVVKLPAVIFLGVWFGIQVVFGLASNAGGGGIAWWAHAGGFAAGMGLIRFFRNPRLCRYCYVPERRDYEWEERG